MNILWGTLMTVIGLFMLVCGTVKSEFVVYRLLVARSHILWGDAASSHVAVPPGSRFARRSAARPD